MEKEFYIQQIYIVLFHLIELDKVYKFFSVFFLFIFVYLSGLAFFFSLTNFKPLTF